MQCSNALLFVALTVIGLKVVLLALAAAAATALVAAGRQGGGGRGGVGGGEDKGKAVSEQELEYCHS